MKRKNNIHKFVQFCFSCICRLFQKGGGGAALLLIGLYRVMLSPLKPPCCRFTPTCSAYAREAFLLHGVLKGAILTFKRILRCHPWGGYGYDPVPPKQKD